MLLVFGCYCKVLSMIQRGFKSTCSNRNTGKRTSCIIVSTVFWILILFPFPFLFCLGCWWNTFAAEPRWWWRGRLWVWKCDCKVVSPHTHTLRTAQCERTNRLWLIRSEACLTLTPRILCCYECRLQREGALSIENTDHWTLGSPPGPLPEGWPK